MTAQICDREPAVLDALAHGSPPPELSEHIAVCAACSETAAVWNYLHTLEQSKDESAESPLPSPNLIWWRAQLAERQALAERSVVAINVVQKAAVVLAVVFIAIAAFVWGRDVVSATSLPLSAWVAIAVCFVGAAVMTIGFRISASLSGSPAARTK